VTETETYDLRGIDTVKMLLGSADVEVISKDVDEAVFTIKKSYRSADKDYVDELLDNTRIVFDREGSTLVLERKDKKKHGVLHIAKGWVSIDITATLPADLALDIISGSGDMDIDDRTGPITIHTGSGDLIADAAGGGFDAHSGSGDMRLRGAMGHVYFETGSGDIYIGDARGEVRVSAGSGDVEIEHLEGDISVTTGSGDIEVDSSEGEIYVKTGSGDVIFDYHRGAAEISTSSGDIEFAVTPREGDVILGTSSGDVDVVVNDGESMILDVNTSTGSMNVRIPIMVKEASRQRLEGIAGDGEWTLRISTSSGDVSVRRGTI
jgi:DUF4097 and DUF4098 domain-containing protein YvlB